MVFTLIRHVVMSDLKEANLQLQSFARGERKSLWTCVSNYFKKRKKLYNLLLSLVISHLLLIPF